MRDLLYEHSADVTHWVCEQIPHLRHRIPYFERGQVLGPAQAIGVLKDGVLVAGVVYHNYDPFVRAIEVTCAASTPRWGGREHFGAILRYPFVGLKCQRVTAVTPRRATSPRRFLEGLGFKREGSIERGFGDDNAIVYGLLAERWEAGPYCWPPRRRGLTGGEEVRTGGPGSA